MEVPNDIGSSLPCLVELRLDDNNFGSLPSLSGLSMLLILSLNGCGNLVEITDLPQSLVFLHMDDCFALERMPDFSSMSTMVILVSPKLIEFPGLDSALNSGLKLCMTTHNNVMDFLLKDSTLQVLSLFHTTPISSLPRKYACYVCITHTNLVQHGIGMDRKWNHDSCRKTNSHLVQSCQRGYPSLFEVPKEIGCNAKALAVCLACCS